MFFSIIGDVDDKVNKKVLNYRGVKPYFYMEPTNGGGLSVDSPIANASNSQWQMVRDTGNKWGVVSTTGPYRGWPSVNTHPVNVANGVLGLETRGYYSSDLYGYIGKGDIYIGDSASTVWDIYVNSGFDWVGTPINPSTDPAWGIRGLEEITWGVRRNGKLDRRSL